MSVRFSRRALAATLATALLAAGGALAIGSPASAAPSTTAYGLTDAGRLVTFAVGSPGAVTDLGAVSGVASGQTLVGLDFRPANGTLVALGVDASLAVGNARLYTINTGSAVATPVGTAPITIDPGTSYGFDFNPTVDRIRVITNEGTSYRLHPDTGAVAFTDTSLAFVAGDPNFGDAPSVSSAGYTNTFGGGSATVTGAKGTTLFGIDAGNDVLVAVDNPNTGETRTIGALGVDVSSAQLDITSAGVAYAAYANGGTDSLATVNLASGALSAPVTIGVTGDLTALAIETATASPSTGIYGGWAVTEAGTLASFDLDNPSVLRPVAPITGLAAGYALEGIDFRPSSGHQALYGVAVSSSAAKAQLVTIDLGTGAATAVGAPATIVPAAEYGVDFNPTVDQVRLVTSAGGNYRILPATGELINSTSLAYVPADPGTGTSPGLTSTAYANSFGGALGTVHYGIDATQSSVVSFTNSNNGTLKTIKALSLGGSPLDVVGDTGLDVSPDGRVFATIANGGTKLYTVSVASGVLTAAAANAAVGDGGALRAFSIGPKVVTITANAQTKVFGAPNPPLTATATGFIGADTAAVIDTPATCTTTATTGSAGGTYPITCSGAVDSAYRFTYVAGTLTVTPAPVVLTVSPVVDLAAPHLKVKLGVAAGRLTSGGVAVPGQTITFRVGASTLCSAVTDSRGVVKCTMPILGTVQVLLSGGYQGTYAGTASYGPASASTGLIRFS